MKRLAILLLFFIYIIFSNVDFIHSGQFSPIIINTTGGYTFGSDLSVDPGISSTALFVISSSDVFLNLDTHFIEQASTSTQTGIDGVYINPNLDNIRISGGIFKNLSGYAIRVGDGCTRIMINNVNIIGCSGGISLEGLPSGTGIKTASVISCLVDSCTGNGTNPAFGIHMNGCSTSEITNCRFNNNDGLTTGSGYGIWLENCMTTEIVNSIAYGTGGNTQAAGLYLYNCSSCYINNCRFKQTITRDTAATSTVYGVYANSSFTNLFQSCNSASNSNTASSSVGFCAANGTANFFSGCNTTGNKGYLGIGFLLSGTEQGSAVYQCNAIENIGNFIGGFAYGVLLNGPQNCSVLYSAMSGNLAAIGEGLRDTTTNTINLIAGNRAYSNTTTGYDIYLTNGGVFPVVFGTSNNFSNLQNISQYYNLALTL